MEKEPIAKDDAAGVLAADERLAITRRAKLHLRSLNAVRYHSC